MRKIQGPLLLHVTHRERAYVERVTYVQLYNYPKSALNIEHTYTHIIIRLIKKRTQSIIQRMCNNY